MSKPDVPEDEESVWARLEREGREDARRARGPLMLIWTGFLLAAISMLVPVLDLPGAAFWVVFCLALGLGIAGLVGYWSSRRKP